MSKLGVALIAFNRPDYFTELIKSLEAQTDQDVEYHLFSDGAINKFSKVRHANNRDIRAVRELFEQSKLPSKKTHYRIENIGNGINQFEAVEYMSSKYDNFLVIEDDIMLSKHYIQLARKVIPLIKDDIFSINLGNLRTCDKKEIKKNLNKMTYKNTHWFAEIWSSKQWFKIRPHFLDYYSLISNRDYTRRPHKIIRAMFKENGYPVPQSSQDAGKDYSLFKSGMKRLTTVVNRGFYIGRKGMHFTPEKYEKYGFPDMKPYEFSSDEKLKKFSVVE